MSGAYGPGDDEESIATLHRAFDLGVNFLDTSASYGKGHNQELIARAVKGRREKIVIHSKSGSPRPPYDSGNLRGGSPEYLTLRCEQSLVRLGIECLDIFCMSRVDPEIPIEESVGGMARLVEQGKARYIGLSEASAASIQKARKVHPVASLQIEYSLWSRDPEGGNIQSCRELGMGFMAYAPLGRGFLAGGVRGLDDLADVDLRSGFPRFQVGNLDRNLRLLEKLQRFAREKSATPAQLSLAWLMAQGRDIIPIPSSKSRRHLEENLGAMELKLSAADMGRLDEIFPPGAAVGARAKDMSKVNI